MTLAILDSVQATWPEPHSPRLQLPLAVISLGMPEAFSKPWILWLDPACPVQKVTLLKSVQKAY